MQIPADNLLEAVLAPPDVVRAAFGAYNRGALDETERYVAADVEWIIPESALHPGTIRGAGELRRLMDSEFEAFSEIRREPLELAEDRQGRVRATIKARMRGRSSGIELEMAAPFAFTVSEGRIVRAEALG
jgi:ketosteroid isomerase-like protein